MAIKSTPESCSWSLRIEKAILYELRGCREIVRCFSDEDFKSTDTYGKFFYNIVLEYPDGGTVEYLINSRGGWVPEYKASWNALMLLRGLS